MDIITRFLNEYRYVFWYLGTGIGGLKYEVEKKILHLVMNKTKGGLDVLCDEIKHHYDWCRKKHEWVFVSSREVSIV